MTFYLGVDIGSTAAKAVALEEDGQEIIFQTVMPTGWSSAETAQNIKERLAAAGWNIAEAKVIATGYGRVSVPYADKTVTEISCHAQGVQRLFGRDCMVIDIGGQDTKIISLQNGQVADFIMNDKCSAGTGRFLEIMANTLGVNLAQLFSLAGQGGNVSISSTCTVFAESEVIGLIGAGRAKADIAYGICESIVSKVAALAGRQAHNPQYYLSGGLCESAYLRNRLSEKLRANVESAPLARYAGALGAAILATKLK